MKVLKIILFIVAILFLLLIVLGFLGPKTYDVNRTVTIDAAKDIVYNNVANLSAQDQWAPWKESEPDMVTTIHGTDGEVGAYSHWKSSQSEGEQQLTNLVPNELVETHLKFMSPMQSESDGYFRLSDADEGATSVTWGFKGENDFMGRAMSMVGLDMDAFVGDMFEKGLQNLKGMSEKQAADKAESMKKMMDSGFAFGIQERPATSYVLKRELVKMEEMQTFFAMNFPAIYTAVGASGNQPAGQPCGIYYSWDEENGQTDMCAAIPVTNSDIRIEGFETVTLPAGRAVKLAYYGSYEGSAAAHYAMDDYLKANGLEVNGPVMEQYITDPTTEPDTSRWLTDIYYHIK